MRILLLNSIKINIWIFAIILLTQSASSLHASSCNMRTFNIRIADKVSTQEILNQLSNECGFSIVIKDSEAKEKMDEKLYGINIKNMTIAEVFDVLIESKGLNFEYGRNLLSISGLLTKTFRIDYVNTERTGKSSTDISLSGDNGSESAKGGTLSTGATITSNDTFGFWGNMEREIGGLLNRPSDKFKSPAPLVNKEAGLITVSGTKRQLKRVEKYINNLMSRLHRQVMIDVQILSVNLDNSKSTGVNWAEIYKLQNVNLNYGIANTNNMGTMTSDGQSATYTLPSSDYEGFPSAPAFDPLPSATGTFFKAGATVSINELVNFLKTQGDVSSVSNPKVVTLNNQPAVFSSGDQLYYKIKSSSATSQIGAAAVTSENEVVQSVFAGILLDITPEITDHDEIILKINPSISSVKSQAREGSGVRTLPPDLTKKQISSVVKLKDGEKVILGGLINTKKGKSVSKVPILGNIPLLGYAFKQDRITEVREELVIVITPHILNGISNNYEDVSLKNLGYENIK